MERSYYKGYPAVYRSGLAREIQLAAIFMSPFFLTAAGAGYAISLYVRLSLLNGVFELEWLAVACAGILVFCCWVVYGNLADIFVARLVPCFQESVGVVDSFSSGKHIARCCEALDDLAREQGVPTLSFFGEWDPRTPYWHTPESGLAVVTAIASGIRTKGATVGNRAQVLEDLGVLKESLRQAAEKGVSFRLVLRHGEDKMISPVEMDRIDGTFW